MNHFMTWQAAKEQTLIENTAQRIIEAGFEPYKFIETFLEYQAGSNGAIFGSQQNMDNTGNWVDSFTNPNAPSQQPPQQQFQQPQPGQQQFGFMNGQQQQQGGDPKQLYKTAQQALMQLGKTRGGRQSIQNIANWLTKNLGAPKPQRMGDQVQRTVPGQPGQPAQQGQGPDINAPWKATSNDPNETPNRVSQLQQYLKTHPQEAAEVKNRIISINQGKGDPGPSQQTKIANIPKANNVDPNQFRPDWRTYQGITMREHTLRMAGLKKYGSI